MEEIEAEPHDEQQKRSRQIRRLFTKSSPKRAGKNKKDKKAVSLGIRAGKVSSMRRYYNWWVID
ncbi:hypothetical protein YDYSY3_48730 [Paenibacillus chitinolyticus]|nr:hypothetical protein YDYSY3_48730 [Paenibacillus chitinolyticus]